MPKVNCKTYSRGVDGYYHTRTIERKPNAPKYKKKEVREMTERAQRCRELRESDAEVCRRCTRTKCSGTSRCVEKERQRQAKERNNESER